MEGISNTTIIYVGVMVIVVWGCILTTWLDRHDSRRK